MKHVRLILLVFCLFSTSLFAQQIPLVSFFTYNWTLINPAAIPREAIELRQVSTLVNLNCRYQQHIVVSEAPQIYDLRYEHVFANDDKVGAFLNSESDGIIRNQSVSANFAKFVSLQFDTNNPNGLLDFGNILFGLTTTYRLLSIDAGNVTWNNPSLLATTFNQKHLDLSFGAFWFYRPIREEKEKWSDQFKQEYSPDPYGYIGVSNIQAIQLGYSNYYREASQWNGLAGIVYHRWELSTWVRNVPNIAFVNDNGKTTPISTDLNLRYYYRKKGSDEKDRTIGNGLWFGAGVSSAKTVSLECGVRYWPDSEHQRGINLYYIQMGLAYSGFSFSSQPITQPSMIELNVSVNFAK